jgi:hypothetical protein
MPGGGAVVANFVTKLGELAALHGIAMQSLLIARR